MGPDSTQSRHKRLALPTAALRYKGAARELDAVGQNLDLFALGHRRVSFERELPMDLNMKADMGNAALRISKRQKSAHCLPAET